jgi:phospholipase/carboxylesterase
MTKENLSLYHIVRESSITNGNAPVLIMLHGYGSDENDLFSFAPELPEELYIISVRAPHTLQPYGNAWYAINPNAEKGKWSDNVQATQSRDLIATFIDEVCNTYPVDLTNITLLGFSQGTILSYAVALTYPEKVKHIIALSGYINKDIMPKNYLDYDYSSLDFYCSHGSVDQVIPVNWARQTPSFLESLNIKHKYSEFPVGHGVAPQNFYELKAWLQDRI